MRKILLTIEYDGSKFCGWQIQPTAKTIQEVLENKLSLLLNEKITLFASGRTDSGVHAIKQTAHFETNSNFDIKKLPLAINHNLENVAVLSAKEVKTQDFHARYSVKQKTYLYKTYANTITRPLMKNRAYRINEIVLKNYDKMLEASKYFIGTHNFLGFCATGNSTVDFVRTIYSLKIKKVGQNIDFYITGSGFLYNMVRIIVGTLLKVGEGKISPTDIPKIIESKQRKLAGPTVPAYGLYLYNVKY